MTAAILGKKIGMTRVFGKDGASVPVTVVQAGPCPILQVKTKDCDGYEAVQLGFENAPGKSEQSSSDRPCPCGEDGSSPICPGDSTDEPDGAEGGRRRDG